MKRSEVTTGTVYAVQLMNSHGGMGGTSKGAIVPGFAISTDPNWVARRCADRRNRYPVQRTSSPAYRPFLLVVQGRLRAGLSTSDYIDPFDRHSRTLDAAAVATQVGELTSAAWSSTAAESKLPDGYTLVEAESKQVLGEWDAYWADVDEKAESAAQTAAAAEVEAERIWEAAAAPLRALTERLDGLGLPVRAPDITRTLLRRNETVPRTTFRVEADVLARILDALPEGWTFNPDPATAEDGWSWNHRAGDLDAATHPSV